MLSMSIPPGPRNPSGYTAEEVERALRGVDGSRKLSFRYELLDRNLNKIRDLDNVRAGSIQQTYISEIKRTASFEIQDRGDIDYLHDFIKPYCRLWMPPRWTEETELPRWGWQHKFPCDASTPLTDTEPLNSTGSPVDAISEQVGLVTSPRIASSGSLRLGDGGSTGGYFLTNAQIDVSGERRQFRTHLYLEQGATMHIAWRNVVGAIYGDLFDLANGGFVINGRWSQVWLGNTDMGSSVYDSMVGRWVRVEIDHDYNENTVEYRLYVTNPYGPDADVTHLHHVPSPVEANKIQGFEMGKWEDDGTFPDARVFVGPTALGDLVPIPSRPNPTDHDFVEVPLGVFMPSSPEKSVDKDRVVTRSVDADDRTRILIDAKLTERFVVTKGEVYTDVIMQFLVDQFPNIPMPFIVEPSTWVCGRTREFSVGTSVKEVIDRLAESINYHTVRFDEEGVLVLRSYVSPGDRTPEFHYTNDEYSIMDPEVGVAMDLTDIANVWITSLNEADEDPVFIKLENVDPANPFSIPSRGRRIVDFREQEEGFDRASLLRKAKRIQFEANRVYENISFKTLINPFHSSNDCYTMEYTPVGVNNSYTEINWEFNLEAGAEMTHTCRRIVELDPELFEGFVDGHLEVNGVATMSNIKWGSFPANYMMIANQPRSLTVTGLNLKGTGKTHVFATARSTAPYNVKGLGIRNPNPDGFVAWIYRANTTATGFYWVAMRDV